MIHHGTVLKGNVAIALLGFNNQNDLLNSSPAKLASKFSFIPNLTRIWRVGRYSFRVLIAWHGIGCKMSRHPLSEYFLAHVGVFKTISQ